MTRMTKIEKEIKEYTEKNHDTLIPASCMRRVIKEILTSHGDYLRMSREAQAMLQTEAEAMLTQKFSQANKIAKVARRETISCADFKLVDQLQ